MKKAGNLRHAFARTSGEAVVIFDADFCPRSDFLRETLPYLMDPSIGIVQTPQCFRWCKEQTWIEKGAGTSQEFFYRMEQASVTCKCNFNCLFFLSFGRFVSARCEGGRVRFQLGYVDMLLFPYLSVLLDLIV